MHILTVLLLVKNDILFGYIFIFVKKSLANNIVLLFDMSFWVHITNINAAVAKRFTQHNIHIKCYFINYFN